MSEAFRGNTKKDPDDFTMEDKSEYRKHNYLLNVKKKERDKEILKRLEEEKKKTK